MARKRRKTTNLSCPKTWHGNRVKRAKDGRCYVTIKGKGARFIKMHCGPKKAAKKRRSKKRRRR